MNVYMRIAETCNFPQKSVFDISKILFNYFAPPLTRLNIFKMKFYRRDNVDPGAADFFLPVGARFCSIDQVM